MKISYAITVCNEFVEIQRLINFLVSNKRSKDEIIILYDEQNGDPEIETYLRSHSVNGEFNWHKGKFNNHFADWKNKLTSYCSGDYIFQIDADEYLHPIFIEHLPDILESNSEVDLYWVPRINTVEGLTQDHIKKWGWRVDNEKRVNFPDYQSRILKNISYIKWENKVHEVVKGYKIETLLPTDNMFCLLHPKTISKQERQNEFYNKL